MIVKAAVARHRASPFAIETLDLDEPRDDEILVRLIASGVGRGDLEAIAGEGPIAFPFVAGGEGAGIVERVGAGVTTIAPGDTVVLTRASCGACSDCHAGAPRACAKRADLNEIGARNDGSLPFSGDGTGVRGYFAGQSSFATHVLCAPSCAIKIPADAPLEVLACLGGDLQDAAGAVMHGLALVAGDAIVITGAAAAGLVATMTAHALGAATIIVADPDPDRRALATELGATLTVHTDDDLSAVVKSLTGAGTRLALETTGHAAALEACLASLEPGGHCGRLHAAATLHDGLAPAAHDPDVVQDMERASGLPQTVVQTLVAWHAAGRFPIDRLVAFFPFEHVNDALDALANGSAVKPVIRFSLGAFGDVDRAQVEGAMGDAPVEAPETDDVVPSEAPLVPRLKDGVAGV